MPKKFDTDSPTFDEIQAVRKPRRLSEWIPLDTGLLDRLDELERDLSIAESEDATEHRNPQAPAIRAELDELRTRINKAAVKFVAQALPRKEYRDLIAEHPAVDEKMRWNSDTFLPALISRCIVEPVGVDGAVVWDEWDDGIAQTIAGMCVTVNEGAPKVPFSVRSTEQTHGSPQSSTTAPLEG